jgi:hypothetical protein
VKLHAIGLVVPLVVGAVLLEPGDGWRGDTATLLRTWLRRNRRVVAAAAVVWLALVLVLNAGAPPFGAGDAPTNALPTSRVVAALLLAGLGVTAATLLLARTRFREQAFLGFALVAAVVGGVVVPNLFWAGTTPRTVQWIVEGLRGEGVNYSAEPLVSFRAADIAPWAPVAVVAAIGFARGLRNRELDLLVWAAGAGAMALLATLRFGYLRYYMPVVVLLVPLVLRAFGRARVAPAAAAASVAALVALPYWLAANAGRDVRARADEIATRSIGWTGISGPARRRSRR